MDFERLMTLIVIPIFVGVVINKISNKKKTTEILLAVVRTVALTSNCLLK